LWKHEGSTLPAAVTLLMLLALLLHLLLYLGG
jgi:hypothetical protein